jgi:hypothetical protein
MSVLQSEVVGSQPAPERNPASDLMDYGYIRDKSQKPAENEEEG